MLCCCGRDRFMEFLSALNAVATCLQYCVRCCFWRVVTLKRALDLPQVLCPDRSTSGSWTSVLRATKLDAFTTSSLTTVFDSTFLPCAKPDFDTTISVSQGLYRTSRLLCATRTPRTDCSTSAGGGLAVIYNSVLSVRPQRLPSMMSFKTFEYQLVSVTWARPAFTIANVYRSLNTPVSSFYNDLLDFLCTVGSMSDRLIVCGDLNCLCPDSSLDPGLTVVIDAFGLTHAHLQQ